MKLKADIWVALRIALSLAVAVLLFSKTSLANVLFLCEPVSSPATVIKISSKNERICWARYLVSSRSLNSGTLEEKAFRVPCPEQMTPELIRSLQRALKIRGYFGGAVTGHADVATSMAVRAFQRDRGFDSPILTLETVVSLGLLPSFMPR